MNKEQQIEEMQKKMQKCYEKYGSLNFKWFAEALFEAGYRQVPKGSFICSGSETNLDVEVCNNCGMKQADELFERDKEIERLKAENKQLQEQLNSANAGNVNCSGCGLVGTNAVKEFAEWAKDHITDVPFCNQKAYNIFCDMVNKKLKEYCND